VAGILGNQDAHAWKARIAARADAPDAGCVTSAAASSEPHIIRATALADASEDALQRVAKALRGARARTGLSEGHVVELLAKRGVAINLALLRRAERTGVVDLALAVSLADAYGTTTDGLAGRRLYGRRPAGG
jgi:hypothetical protein